MSSTSSLFRKVLIMREVPSLVYLKSHITLLAILLMCGCATAPPPPPPPRIDYSLPSVPEEGGISFTKITEDEETVSTPLRGPGVDYWIERYRSALSSGSQSAALSVLGEVREHYSGERYLSWQIFSITDKKIAYVGYKNEKRNVFIKELKGGRALQQRTFTDNVLHVSFSPDGENIAFADDRDGNYNIYTIASESGFAIRQITRSDVNELYPVFSPDNLKVLFCKRQGEVVYQVVIADSLVNRSIARYYLWTYDLTNGALTQYVRGWGPSFTPDGKKVVVVRFNTETEQDEIWLIDIEKGQEFLIVSSQDRSFSECSVSPDGKKLAVVSASRPRANTPRNYDIFFVNIDGTDLTQMTFHPGHDICPRWSHDGRSLYFVSQRATAEGKYNIWRMNLK